ncbi:hypothetical protein B0F90DRAFT_1622030 [Multifurca ochricompacta]|uniref:Uncharacterized protein n=1 Tax=Multifurca ochricompacta TaxID=376703 RepID=A0AAD4MBY0_9AGAM|nr:hypothetical protein B0F90DRAFT_1622030 [Multifurca ochricompacta]
MASSIAFPSTEHRSQPNKSDTSLIPRHTAAIEVCNLVYGQADSVSWDTLSLFYEADAGGLFFLDSDSLHYENPVITATSRDSIGDIHSLSQHLTGVDAPKPASLLRSLLGLAHTPAEREPWFQISRMWTEVDDVCENESFDGHRRCIVEHTLNILLLPGLHSERYLGHMNAAQPYALTSDVQRNSPNRSLHVSFSSVSGPWLPSLPSLPSLPALTVPGIGLSLPSPFHLQLHVFTRLSFNEQGRIIHHRDVWDLKDLIGLVPGGMLSQWVTSRLAARVLSTVSRFGAAWVSNKKRGEVVGSSRKRAESQ